MSYVPDPELPGPVTAALGSAVGAVERFGWFVLIGALVLWYAYSRWQEYARRRAVYNSERVSRLTADMRERRAAQQAAWDSEAHAFRAGGAAAANSTAAEHKADRMRAKLYGMPGKAQLNDGSEGSVAAAADALELPVPLPKADKKKSSAAAAGASAADTKEQRANRPQLPSDGAQPKPKPKPKFGDKPAGGFRPFFGSNSNSGGGAGGSSARWGRIKPAACGPSGG